MFHAHAFDAVDLILDAVEASAVQRRDRSLVIRRSRFRDAFFATDRYPGITGELTCEPDGDCASEPIISIHPIRDGDFGPPPDSCDYGFSKCYNLAEL